MANLIKKVIVLGLLLIVVFAVYMVKNQDIREDVLIKLGLAAAKDFKIPEDIKIGMKDINIEGLEQEVGNTEEVEEITALVDEPASIEITEGEEGIGMGSEEAWKEEAPRLSLEEIEEQIKEISLQVELIKKEVEIMIAMQEINQEIKGLANQEQKTECIDCDVSSI